MLVSLEELAELRRVAFALVLDLPFFVVTTFFFRDGFESLIC